MKRESRETKGEGERPKGDSWEKRETDAHEKLRQSKWDEQKEKARRSLDESGWERKKSKAQERLKDEPEEKRESKKKTDASKVPEEKLEQMKNEIGDLKKTGFEGDFDAYLDRQLEDIDTESTDSRESRRSETEEDSEKPARTESRFGEIRSRDDFERALEYHSDLKMLKSFEKQYEDVKDYFEKGGSSDAKPKLLEKVEKHERRRLWNELHTGPPRVPIESMDDVEKLLDKYPKMRDAPKFDESRRQSEVYFKVQRNKSSTREQLAKIHGIAPSTAGYYRAGREPRLMSELRKREEERLIGDWAETRAKRKMDGEDSLTRHRKELTGRSIYQANPESVGKALSKLHETKPATVEDFSKAVNGIFSILDRDERMMYADLRDVSKLDTKDVSRLESQFRKNRWKIQKALSKDGRNVRFGVADGRLYVWTPDASTKNLSHAWRNEYFYFRDRKDFARFIDETRNHLAKSGSLHESANHLNDLMKQMLHRDRRDLDSMPDPIGRRSRRLRGDAMQFSLDVQGAKLKDLEGRLAKVTGEFGNAGIKNPKFPEGKELELLRARLTATFISDGHLRPSGRIGYVERNPDRIARVRDTLKQIGDVEIRGYSRNGLREFEIPREVGVALTQWGDMTPGDKAITNPSLSKSLLKAPKYVRRAYLKEMIPEDGSFHPSRGFSWNRSHALHAGDKTEEYGFKSLLTPKEIDFIKRHGTKSEDLVEGKSLSMEKLKELRGHRSPVESKTANRLFASVMASPNRLLEGERDLAKSLGINVERQPDRIRYYEKSGRVSVRWGAQTSTTADAIKWAEQCPPNDVKKRGKVEDWLWKRSV